MNPAFLELLPYLLSALLILLLAVWLGQKLADWDPDYAKDDDEIVDFLVDRERRAPK